MYNLIKNRNLQFDRFHGDVHHSYKSQSKESELTNNEDQVILVMECQRQFGNEKFIFYYPQNIGNFVVSCWSSIRSIYPSDSIDIKSFKTDIQRDHSKIYGMTIYENGEIIDPTSDNRLKNSNLLSLKGIRSWANHTFTRKELLQMLEDLKNVAI